MTNAPTLQFLGGTGTVTGSKFLLRSAEATVLVDCGLFQGPRALRERNWTEPPFDSAAIDAVVVTHAHIDHTGYLPRLVAAGYRGPIYATARTLDLARIILPDSGHLQEEEAAYANRKGISRHEPALALFTEQDAWSAVEQLVAVSFGVALDVAPGMQLVLSRAGHILGSASIRLTVGRGGPVVVFSGDLGRPTHPLLVPPDPPGRADVLVVESTYGDRRHSSDDGSDQLARVISTTIAGGGSVLIPAFAVDRTEVLLHRLSKLAAEGRLPYGVPVYVDSPMALSALGVYREGIDRGDADVRPELTGRTNAFELPGLREVRDVEGSKALNDPAQPSIIVSASGMGTGGRVVHHLAHLLPDPRNTVVLVGFQAAGTRGRQLVEGARELKMLGRYVRVRAQIVDLTGFSVHADQNELLRWVGSCESAPDAVFVVHGEADASSALAARITDELDWLAIAPQYRERVRLDPI